MSETTINGTTFGVPPNTADWYYCAIVDRFGETDYVDGYATGDEPTESALQEYVKCHHSWIGGMMHIHDEDVEAIAATRPVECGKCGNSYADRDKLPLTILEWEVNATPQGKYANK